MTDKIVVIVFVVVVVVVVIVCFLVICSKVEIRWIGDVDSQVDLIKKL